jgi:Protein of unknown function (DUF2726)
VFKKLLNQTETITHQLLEATCSEYGARVYPKLRIADILPIESSGITDSQYTFALQSHVDFFVAEGDTPLFAVEFDGESHLAPAQMDRDRLKDQLCQRFGLPLIRINARFLTKSYRQMDLLSWFVHVWFLQRGFDEAQSSGAIPPDEPFCAWSFCFGDRPFPLFLSAAVREKIRRVHANKQLADRVPSYYMGRDENHDLRGLTWIKVDDNRWLCAKSGMRSQQFPIDQTEVFSDILVFAIWEKIERFLKTGSGSLDNGQLDSVIHSYMNKVKSRCFCGVARARDDEKAQP